MFHIMMCFYVQDMTAMPFWISNNLLSKWNNALFHSVRLLCQQAVDVGKLSIWDVSGNGFSPAAFSPSKQETIWHAHHSGCLKYMKHGSYQNERKYWY